jgi:hypothetical protein
MHRRNTVLFADFQSKPSGLINKEKSYQAANSRKILSVEVFIYISISNLQGI